jgi:hypothetical protein
MPRPRARDIKPRCGRGDSSAMAVRITLVLRTIGRACGRLSPRRGAGRRKIQSDRCRQENESKLLHGKPLLFLTNGRLLAWPYGTGRPANMRRRAAEEYEEVHKGGEIDADAEVSISESDLRIASAFASCASRSQGPASTEPRDRPVTSGLRSYPSSQSRCGKLARPSSRI